jgi:hypothetical protein
VRRGLGRGRTLIALGAVLVILSMPLPWLRVGGVVLSAETANGFDGPGALLFVVCLAMLAVIVLPYSLKNRQAAVDRVATYVLLWCAAAVSLGGAIATLVGTQGATLTPLAAPGLWLGLAGMALLTWGLLELIAERPSSP